MTLLQLPKPITVKLNYSTVPYYKSEFELISNSG